ncbi:hypothetical protein BKG93_00905 [Rodentibacter ratti]|uniref:Uncharacterized protein n=1 Tax=Rodentibacter ratti TaxID=1906745 RepID=A0A1V3LCD4_9PAST|nr:YadA-like family protein [Rodentibacter ratti]OOF87705.1 hypothetical protein BKG93_00905 [Rodentibacter ratti]
MNKIFKVIWNQSIGAWVAVSELAKGYCKSASGSQAVNGEESTRKEDNFTISKIAFSLLIALGVNNAFAATEKGNRKDVGDDRTIVIGESGETNGAAASAYTGSSGAGGGLGGTSTVAHSIAIGGRALIGTISQSMSLGYNTLVTSGYSTKGSVALGAHSVAGKSNTGDETKSITIGGQKYTYAGAPTNETSVLSIGYGNNKNASYSNYASSTTREDYAKYRQIQNVAAGRVADNSTDAINGSQLYAVVKALDNINTNTDGLKDFVVGADKNHSATGINVTKAQNRFDVISGNESYLTTAVDGTSIKVDLSQKSKDAIDNVSKNAQNITKNAQNITNNTQNITKNAQNITKNAGDIAKGFGLKAQDNQTVNKKLGEYVDVIGGNSNINTTVANGKIQINLNNSLDLGNGGNVKLGNTNLNSTGLTISNGPSVTTTGINAGNKKITNVSNGTVDANSKDAVNGSQLYATNQNVTNLNTEVNKGWNITTSKSGTGNVSGTNLSKVAMGETVTLDAGDNINITQVGKKVTIATSLTPSFNSVNTGNLTVRPNGNVNFGNNRLTNVANGTNGTDAVNLNQLNALLGSKTKPSEVKAGNNVNVTKSSAADGHDIYTVNAEKSTVSNGSDKVTVTSTPGENNTTNYAVDLSDSAKQQLAKEESVNSTTSNLIVSENGKNSTGGKNYSVNLNNTLDLTNVGSVKTGDTLLNSTGLTINNGPSVTNAGINAGNKPLTNVAAPTNNTDAANKKYVDDGRTTVNSTDGSVTVNGTGTNPKNYDLSVNMSKVANDVKLKYKGDNNTSGENKLADQITFKGSTDIVTNATNGQVAFDLADATKQKINNAVQNFTVGADKNNQATGLNITNGGRFDIVGKEGKYIETTVDGKNITVGLNDNATSAIEKAHKGFGLKAQDGNNATKQLGEAIEVEGGNSNINTTVESGKVKVNLNNTLDLSDAGSVKLGDTTLNSTGLTINNGPKVTKNGVDAGNKKVTNVTAGELSNTSKDAVNGSQLYATNQNVTNLSTEVNKGWNITTSKSGTGTVSGTNLSKVAMGETVTLEAGDNINITQADKKITIATSLTPNFTSVTTGNLTVKPSGKVDFGGNNLSNIGTPVADNDATTKKYVDDGRTTVNSTDGSVIVNGTGTNPKNYDLSVNMIKVAEDVKFKYSGDNNSSGENKLSETVRFKGSDYVTTNASNGQIAFDLSDTAKNKINNAIQNFTVGADKNNQTTGLNITNGGRFDIVGKDGNYIETNVSGKNITVGLNANATEAIEKAHKGFGLKAQDGSNVTKQLGEAIEIEGGNSNLNTTVADGKVKINLNNSLDLTDAGNVKIGDVNLTKDGLTINGGPNVTKDGINAGDKTITNVLNGTNATDAVNLSQLNASTKAAKTEVVAGKNINVTNVTGNDGQTIYTVNAEKSVVSNGSSNITVTATPNATTGITDYSVDLSDETKAQIKKEESVVAASDRVTVTQSKTNSTGGKEFEVDVNAQKVVEAAQLPVVYTNKDGDKLVKVGDKFYKAGDVTNGTANAGATEVAKGDVIASLNNGDNNTTAPMTLSNLQSTLDKVTNTTTSNPDKTGTGTKYDNATNNAATVGDVLNAGWNLKANGNEVDFVTHGNSVNFNNGQGVKVSTEYNGTTGTTNITFNTTNSYVDANGNPTSEPSNKVKFIGAENGKPVSITNVDSGVLPSSKQIPAGQSFNDVLNNVTGSDLNNVVNVGDLQNATKNITNTSLQAVGFALKTANVSGTNGVAEELTGLTEEGKRLTNNETFNLNASNNIQIKQVENGFEVATTENVTFTNITVGKDGKDGTIGVNGKDGSSVVINGKDGSIGLTGPKGADGKNASANITVVNGTGTLDTDDKGGKGIERLVYNTTNLDGTTKTREIATKDDGLKFKGDNGNEIAKKLGETLNIIGGVSDEVKLTDNNIGLINKDGNLTVKLAKDLNLTENGSVAIGNITLNKDGFNAGNTTITNVKGNLDNVTNDTTSNPDSTGNKYANVTNNAATVGDVLNAGWNLQNNDQAVDFVTHGNTVNFKNGQGVKVGTSYNNVTGTTDITFNTTNSYVDDNGNSTAEQTNKVKFIGANASAPVAITNVDSGVLPNNATIPTGQTFNDVLNNLSGDALNNAVNAGDLKNATKDITNSTLSAVGFALTSKAVANTNGQSIVKDGLSEADKRLTNNETFTLDAGNNVRIKQIENGYEVATAENVTFTNITVGKDGKDGVDGTIGVNGKDGASVVLNGKDGSIGLTGPKGANGKDGASANLTVVNGTGTLDEAGKGKEGITRLVYNTTNTDGSTTTREIATKDDGLKFKGDNGDEIAKKLGETLNITGGLTDSNKLIDNNLGVVNQAGSLVIKLAKDLNLTKGGSLTIGNATLNDNGFTLVGGPNVTTRGIDAGDKKITNVSDGNVSNNSKDAINGGQLYTAITNSGFNLTTKSVAGTNGQASSDGLSDEDKRLANNETFTLDASNNLVIKQIANGYEIATANNITVGAAGKDGKDGVDGSIGVNGKDGASVVINGKDGSIGLTGPKGADGKDGASANISVKDGAKGLDGNDGKNGESKIRIEYVKPNGDKETVATLNDGLKFKGDDGKEIAKKLNETLNITGGADKDKLTDGNIGVNNNNGTLEVKLSKDLNLTENGSVTIGNVTINKDGFNAGNTTITNVKGNLDNVTNDIKSNPDTAGNKYQNITNNAATVGDVLNAGWNLQNNGQAVDFVTHGNTVNFNNGTGVSVNTVYDNATGTTNITFNTTNSYVDNNGALTNMPSNTVKFIGGNASAPVLITNVDSGVLPNGTLISGNGTFNDVLNNITGDALKNAVNVGDLKNATKDITNTTLSAVGFALKSAKVAGSNGMIETADDLSEEGKRLTNNETFNLNAGNNIVIKQINNGYEIATSNNITVGKDGKDGVDGKIGVNGKDGASVVLNGKDGSIGLTGQRGTNGKDGASVNITVANGSGTLDIDDKGGKGIERLIYNTTNADGSTTTREIATKDDGLKFKGDNGEEIAKKLGETLNITGGVTDTTKLTNDNIGVTNENGNLSVKLSKDLNLTRDGSVTIGNSTLNDKGLTIAGGPSVTIDGINAGDKKITNVANGTNATDAVNLSQLNASMAAAKTEVTAGKNVNVTSSTGANNQTIYTVNAEKSVVKGSDSVKVTQRRDEANFTTTYDIDLSDEMKKQIAKEESVSAGDTNVKVVANGTNASGGKNFEVSLNKELNLTKEGSITLGDTTLKDGNLTMGNTTVNNNGVTIKDGPSITNGGIDGGNKKITNVSNGTLSADSKDAVNGSQLYTEIKNSGFNLATNGTDTATDKRINNNDTFILNQGNNIVVKQIDNGYEISTGNNLVIGEKGEPGKDGVDGSIGVNGKDGSSVVINGKDGSIGLTGTRGADGKDGASANISVKNGTKGLDGNDGASKTRIVYEKSNGKTEEVATLNDGLEFMGDSGTVSKQKLNSRVNVVGGQKDSAKLSDNPNVGVVSDGKGSLSVKLAKDINLGKEGSLTIGDTSVNNDGLTIDGGPSVTVSGINAGNKVISNVAPGVKATDAVNKGQLDQVRGDIYNVNNRVDKLDRRVRGIGANAAAASSLPQVMAPGKSMVAAAAGGYSGASAVAVGYSRASDNGKVILKLTGTANSAGHYSGGVGVGYQW